MITLNNLIALPIAIEAAFNTMLAEKF